MTNYMLSVLVIGVLGVANAPAASELVQRVGRQPALVVIVSGPGEMQWLDQLLDQTPWTLCCVLDAATARQVRERARSGGQLGRRVFVLDSPDKSLWLADDMADAVWVRSDLPAAPSETEMLRVLRPGGICLTKDKVLTKPVPRDADQWTHPYHGPDNNVVSHDRRAGLPGELRFQTYPVFAAMPNQTLVAGGRIFFFTGHIAFHEREEPLLDTLIALNAYNGLTLWRRSLQPQYVVHNLAKVATEREVIFAEGPVLWRLDAATGAVRARLTVPDEAASAGDTDWKWLALSGNTLFAAWGPPDGRVAPYRLKRRLGHWPWNVANEQYKSVTNRFGAARWIGAYRFPEMKLLWTVREDEPFDVRTLCVYQNRIFALAPTKYAVAWNAATGKPLWRQTPETAADLFRAVGPPLLRQGWGLGWATYTCARAGEGVVCLAGPLFRRTIGVSLDDGRLLWTLDLQSPHAFFLQGALYIVPRVGSPSTDCRKIDPHSGEMLQQFRLQVIGSCTRLTATPNQFFYRPGGGQGRTVFVDLATLKLANYVGIVRPGCFDGVIPANGRLYWMPLACDCWQVHGTLCMAPRRPLSDAWTSRATAVGAARPLAGRKTSGRWQAPTSDRPAARDDWPAFRADPAGTATVRTSVGRQVEMAWKGDLGAKPSAPICAAGKVFVGTEDGSVFALDARTGRVTWGFTARAALTFPPVYWNGRVIFGACDGFLYCVDAETGRLLGQIELAPDRRFVNIMGRLMSAWPLGGGVVVQDGTVYAAAGSTAADGAVVAAFDPATGRQRWRRLYSLDHEPQLSFGVQSNLLLKDGRLFVNGGAPTGVVALDAAAGQAAEVVVQRQNGQEMFLQPDGKPWCTGPELYTDQRARTTIFKPHQGRVYFHTGDVHIALAQGRLFASHSVEALDRLVKLLNTDPRTRAKITGSTDPWDIRRVPLDHSIVWASEAADVRGLAIGTDGLVALHGRGVQALSADGKTVWRAALPATPVRWGIALTGSRCVVTLTNGEVVCFQKR
ncbi:MAG: PQQ-binding-like beta-propeller repeat protein [Planctomycetes bacterium]|nr:PQQ-binding-like beta-propeller repeat protein [Planctomycetota bacterium]